MIMAIVTTNPSYVDVGVGRFHNGLWSYKGKLWNLISSDFDSNVHNFALVEILSMCKFVDWFVCYLWRKNKILQ